VRWNEVSSTWTVPNGHNYSNCDGAITSVWAGIGGDGWDGGNSNALIQGGSDTTDRTSGATANLWWEDWNYNGPIPITNFPISPGDSVYMDAHYLGGTYTSFTYEDYATGQFTTWGNRYTPNVDQSTADFVVEGYPKPYFVKFGSVPFSSPVASGTWGSGYNISKDPSQASVTQFNADNSNNQEVAYPGAISTGGNFTVYSTQTPAC
jgi:hypothetical protein